MVSLDNFEELRRRAARAQQQCDRAAGAMDAAAAAFADEFGCRNAADEERVGAELERTAETTAAAYRAARAALEAEFPDLLADQPTGAR